MQIEVDSLDVLEKPGVYKILNLVNGKYYIGSSQQKIRLRLNHHIQALRNNNHKNSHLQRAWNKYGENNFVFLVLENCEKTQAYEREQFYLDNRIKTLSYNINPNATGFCEKEETKTKLAKSRAEFNKICYDYYHKYKNGEIDLKEVPEKYLPTIYAHINQSPWNKGKHYNSTEHLKVKHTMTEKLIQKYKNYSEKRREEDNVVYVYDNNWNFLDSFRSSKDLEELSTELNLPLKSRFSKPRGKRKTNELSSFNINKAIRLRTLYKGLYFTNVPVHQGIDELNEPKSVKSEMIIPR